MPDLPRLFTIAPTDGLARAGARGGHDRIERADAEFHGRVARAYDVHFFDAGTVISSSDDDGIHLDSGAHQTLGMALAGEVRRILELAPSQG